jgi:high-affinity iron transporter
MIAWLILRYSARLPIGLFFAVSSLLLALLAVIFTGHGVKALQEAGWIAASPVDTVHVRALGIYATLQTLLAQAVTLVIVSAAFAWTHFSNRRRATIP